jgi:hypothetical protein
MRLSSIPCLLFALTTASIAATPQYSPRKDIPTNFQHLIGLAVADFNGDGKLDFAVTDGLDKRVVVYLNNGNGTFSAPVSTTLQINNTVGYIVAGDFNEDGKQDLIVATVAGANQDDIFLSGNGDGTFTEQPPLPGSFGFASAAVADLNHDSHLDFIAGGNGPLFIYLGDGHGNFQLQTFSNQGGSGLFLDVVAADFNNDNKIDFAAASPFNVSGVRTYQGVGDGTFSSPTFLTSNLIYSPEHLATADFNGDGKPDLLVGSANIASVIFGNGDGTFLLNTSDIYPVSLPQSSSFSQDPPFVAAADMDADGKFDVVAADDLSKTIDVFINDGTGKFPQATPDFSAAIDAGTAQLRVADLNGDGLPDIILTNYVTQNVSIFFSIRPKTTPTVTLTASANPQFVGAPLSFTAKISGAANLTPTGTVTLMDGTSSLGQQTLDSNGQAAFSVANLAAGQHSLSINYSGDGNYLVTSSTSVTQSVTDFQVSLPSASQTITAGATAAYSLTITPVAGLTGSVIFTCSQLPSLSTCDPLSVPLNGQPATATLSIHTTASVHSQHMSAIKTAELGLVSVLLAAFLPLRRRMYLRLLVGLVAVVLTGFSIGCSGGSSKSTGTVTPGTPSGSTSFTITSSVTLGGQTLTRTTTATLLVQ